MLNGAFDYRSTLTEVSQGFHRERCGGEGVEGCWKSSWTHGRRPGRDRRPDDERQGNGEVQADGPSTGARVRWNDAEEMGGNEWRERQH